MVKLVCPALTAVFCLGVQLGVGEAQLLSKLINTNPLLTPGYSLDCRHVETDGKYIARPALSAIENLPEWQAYMEAKKLFSKVNYVSKFEDVEKLPLYKIRKEVIRIDK